MEKKIISSSTQSLPNSTTPYVQAINIGEMLFISGQIGMLSETGIIISKDIQEETLQVLKNIKSIIQISGFNINNIVKTTMFITNIDNIDKINTAYKKFFNDNHATFPTRSCVEVNNLPKHANIEIDAIAIKYQKK